MRSHNSTCLLNIVLHSLGSLFIDKVTLPPHCPCTDTSRPQSSPCTAPHLLVPWTGCLSTSCTFHTSLCSPYAISSSLQSKATSTSSSSTPPLLLCWNSSLARCLLIQRNIHLHPNQIYKPLLKPSLGTWS